MPQAFRFLDEKPDLILPMRFDRAKVHLGNFSYRGIARLKPGVTLAQANADVARMIPMVNRKFTPPPGFSAKMFEEAGIQAAVRPAEERRGRRTGQGALGADGQHRRGAADRLRQRRQPSAGPGRRTPAGTGHSHGSGRRLAPHRRRAAHGERVSRPARRSCGTGVCLRRRCASWWRVAPAYLPRLDDISLDPVVHPVHAGDLAGGGAPLRPDSGFQICRAERRMPTLRAGGRTLSQSKERASRAQHAGGAADRAGGGSADRRRPDDPHLSSAAARPPGIHGRRAVADVPHRHSRRPGEGTRARVPHAAGDPPQDRRDPGRHLGFLCEFGAHRRQQQHRRALRRRPRLRGGTAASAAPLQVRGAGLLSNHGDPAGRGPRSHLDRIYEQRRNVAMVSENLARELWHDPAAALGKRIREGAKDYWREIVGVVGDVRHDGADQKAPTTIYWPVVDEQFLGQREVPAARRGVRDPHGPGRLGEPADANPAGGLVRDSRCPDRQSPHHGRSLPRLHGAQFVHAGHARHRGRRWRCCWASSGSMA